MSIGPIMRCTGRRVNQHFREYHGIGTRGRSRSESIQKRACRGNALAQQPECACTLRLRLGSNSTA